VGVKTNPRFWQDEDGVWWCPTGAGNRNPPTPGRTRCKIKTCEQCGEEYVVSPHVAAQSRFCTRACAGKARTAREFHHGESSPQWKGGRHRVRGYMRIHAPDHPSVQHKERSKRYVLEHRLVIEAHLGRLLEPHEKVHHINGVKDDNRLENLELWTTGHSMPGVRVSDQESTVGERRWFVYNNESYYPDAVIVEADTAEAALNAYKAETRHLGFHGIAVFPLDALALWTCGYETESAIGDVLEQISVT
jgi:hypothetical protein